MSVCSDTKLQSEHKDIEPLDGKGAETIPHLVKKRSRYIFFFIMRSTKKSRLSLPGPKETRDNNIPI